MLSPATALIKPALLSYQRTLWLLMRADIKLNQQA